MGPKKEALSNKYSNSRSRTASVGISSSSSSLLVLEALACLGGLLKSMTIVDRLKDLLNAHPDDADDDGPAASTGTMASSDDAALDAGIDGALGKGGIDVEEVGPMCVCVPSALSIVDDGASVILRLKIDLRNLTTGEWLNPLLHGLKALHRFTPETLAQCLQPSTKRSFSPNPATGIGSGDATRTKTFCLANRMTQVRLRRALLSSSHVVAGKVGVNMRMNSACEILGVPTSMLPMWMDGSCPSSKVLVYTKCGWNCTKLAEV